MNSQTIASGIAAMSVSGVTIKDITAIPQQVQPRECPIMFPHPSEWLQGGNGEPETGPTTFGPAASRSWIFNRGYKYVYLHASAGSGRGLSDHYSGMAGNADAIETAVAQLDISGVDVKNISIDSFGTLQDPAGNSFYGFILTVTMREWINP